MGSLFNISDRKPMRLSRATNSQTSHQGRVKLLSKKVRISDLLQQNDWKGGYIAIHREFHDTGKDIMQEQAYK